MRQGKLYTFQDFVLDVDNACLCQGQEQCALRPKAFDMLRYFVERPGQLVTRDELFRALWPQTVVDGATLTGCIRAIRTALNDDAKQSRFIETVPTRGYRFVASVAASAAPVSSSKFQVQLLRRASTHHAPHLALGAVPWQVGELISARTHFDRRHSLYTPQDRLKFLQFGHCPTATSLAFAASVLWYLG